MKKRKLKVLLAEKTQLAAQFCAERNQTERALGLAREEIATLKADIGRMVMTPVGVQAKVRVMCKDDPSRLVFEYPIVAVSSVHGETTVWVGPRAR